MRDSIEKDTEGLLSKDDLRSSEGSRSSWQETTEMPQWSLRNLRLPSIPIIILCLTNIATLAIMFFTRASVSGPETRPRLNHPPTGVAPSLSHLIREPKSELFNVTFYPHDNPFRQRNSVETDELWEEYTQSSDSHQLWTRPRPVNTSLLTPQSQPQMQASL